MNLNGITGLRWIAAFYVFLFHINMRLHPAFPTFLRRIISQGPLGVTLFFVLSGFILTYTYHRKNQIPYRNFIYKRLARIYPAYVVGWLLCIIVSLIMNYFPRHFLFVCGFDLLAIQSYFPNIALAWYGSGAWSISTEFFFYFLFPLILPVLMRLSKRKLIYILVVSISLSAVPTLLLDVLHFNIQFTKFYCFPPARWPEFISGMCTALLVFKYRYRVNSYFPVIAVLLLCTYFYFWGYSLSIVGNNFIAVPTIILLLSIISNPNKPKFYSWIESKTMVYLGKLSYGFYIMQLPIMMFLDVLNERGGLTGNRWFITALVLAINILMAGLLYHFVEHPAHTNLSKRLERRMVIQKENLIKDVTI